MALKTALLSFSLVLLLATAPAAGQRSPVQWPVPPPGPPREVVLPRILVEAGEMVKRGKDEGLPFVLLDARTAGFEAGHAAGAALAWSDAGEPDGLVRLRSELMTRGIDGEQTVVLYGDDRERVARLFWRLRSAGCKDVRILKGGFTAWRAAGGAVETGPSRRKPAERFLPPYGEVTVSSGWVAQVFFREDVALLDLRDARGWDRWQTPPVYATGHIPSALPFDPGALLPADSGWPEPMAIRESLGRIGARAGDPVPPGSTFVLYAADGRDARLGLSYLLFALAGLDARVYAAGWNGWTSDSTRPVMRVISAGDLAGRLKKKNPDLRQDLRPDDLVLLDLREARDFQIGHLPGAVALPFFHFPDVFQTTITAFWPQASRTTPLVLYCYGIDCVRSLKAGTQAARAGFRDLVWFRGGTQEWRDSGYPLLASPPATREPLPPVLPGDEGGRL